MEPSAEFARRPFAPMSCRAIERGDRSVHDALRHLVPLGVENRRVGHQVTDIAHQHQRPTLGRQGSGPIRQRVGGVAGEPAGEALAALGNLLFQVTLHQAEPVAVDQNLVLGIDRRDRILAVHDGGDGGFDPHVGNASRIGGTDLTSAIDDDLDEEIVAAKQHRLRRVHGAAIAGKLRRVASGRSRQSRWTRRGRHRAQTVLRRWPSCRLRAGQTGRGSRAPRRRPSRRGADCSCGRARRRRVAGMASVP